MDKQKIEIKRELPEQDLNLKVKNDPCFAETTVREHTARVHDDKNKPYRWTFECNVCSKRFGSKSKFYRHFGKVHEKNKPHRRTFYCTICQSKFGSESEFYRHFEKDHEKNKPFRWTFQCTICQSKFGSKSEFDRHFATVHDKNTPYGCSICFKVLDAKATVKEHIA